MSFAEVFAQNPGKVVVALALLLLGAIVGFRIGRAIAKALRPDAYIGSTSGYIKAKFFWTLGLPILGALLGMNFVVNIAEKYWKW